MTTALQLLGWNLLLVVPVAIGVWALCQAPAVRRRPALCHVAWLFVLLKLLTPPAIPVPILAAVSADTDRESATSATAFQAESRLPERKASGTENGFPAPPHAIESSKSDSARQLSLRDSPALPRAALKTVSVAGTVVSLCLLGLSLCVSIAMGISALSQVRRVGRLIKETATQADRAAELLNDVVRRLGLRSAPRLCVVDHPIAPTLWSQRGNSAIILPRQFADSLEEQQLQMVLAHELAHYARRDHWTNWIAFHVTVLFWWHPIAWFARRELSAAAEASCDAWVLERLGASPKSYARTLLAAVDYVNWQKPLRPAFGLTYGQSHSLRRRVELLASPNVTSQLSRTGLMVLALGASILMLYPVHAQGRSEPWQDSSLVTASHAPLGDVHSSHDSSPLANSRFRESDGDSDRPGKRPGHSLHGVGGNSRSGLERALVLLPPDAHTDPRNRKYYVTGMVFDKETKQPIPGAKLKVLVNSERRVLQGTTERDGHYRIEVPLGSCRFWFPLLKPGYWLEDQEAKAGFATSPDKPVAVHDVAARRGATWPIQVAVEGSPLDLTGALVTVKEIKDDRTRQALLAGKPVSFYEPLNQSFSELGPKGAGLFTQSGESGKLVVSVADMQRRIEGFRTEFLVDPRFDMSKIKSVVPVAGTDKVRMIDAAGAQATIGKATVTLREGLPLVTFRVARATPLAVQEFAGRIVDSTGRPIPEVRIGSAIGSKGGSSEIESVTRSGEEGRFAIKIPLIPSSEPLYVVLTLNKDGYAAIDSRRVNLPSKPTAAIDVGSLTLKPGYSLPVRIVDTNGRPLPGAVVEPGGNYAVRRQIIRTDSAGCGVLQNLPSGLVQVNVSYGQQGESERLVVSDVARDNSETTIVLKSAALKSGAAPAPRARPAIPIAIGKAAPEWSVTGWTDHRDRNLSDYRGKVLVLEFWGVWCGPCVGSVPLMQSLATTYEPQGVVFLNIHTPQHDMDQINKLKKLKSWEAPTAVDRGPSLDAGETAERYGVHGFPTMLIIDRDGKISFNSSIQPKDRDAFLTKMKAFAKSKNLPFPSEKSDNEAEGEKQVTALLRAILSTEIDKSLARRSP